jgi:hypothetical protein
MYRRSSQSPRAFGESVGWARLDWIRSSRHQTKRTAELLFLALRNSLFTAVSITKIRQRMERADKRNRYPDLLLLSTEETVISCKAQLCTFGPRSAIIKPYACLWVDLALQPVDMSIWPRHHPTCIPSCIVMLSFSRPKGFHPLSGCLLYMSKVKPSCNGDLDRHQSQDLDLNGSESELWIS